ncbi:BRO family, N-terminal domain [Moraxella caviae]|uniref:BRO family, N-terminal domain n=3 Tax=Moraxella caviae TaxID=34060 RepID=A0A378R9G0_9GAMM|nr:BRO family protein [Moraxella caviae]STZ14038.1 BRO family, N-terminal domain [Moraxella caviae]VEW12826.1 BRO family, N-terminal domain [Moraxella caviae]
MTVLTFQNITLTPAKVDDQIWLTSAELARALGYAEVDGVTKTYNRKADEFTDSMTALVDNPKMKNAKIRIFSLRGCHLVAMFSRTTVAKEFRKWVLDILDKEVGIQTTAADRTPLRQAISALVGAKRIGYDVAYSMVHQRFGVKHIDELTPSQLNAAIEYVHSLTLDTQNEHNALWRLIGILEHERISNELNKLQNILSAADAQLRRIRASRGLIYDGFSEQRIKSHNPRLLQEAKNFINRQHEMKRL